MAITITGGSTNTIAGLAAGGLPDNSVTNADMADDAIGVAELSATGTASSSTYLRGDNSWAAAGGAALTGSTDNTICTVTGSDAIQGETNLRFDGSTLHVNDAATDIGDPQLQVYSEYGPKPGEIGLYSQKGTVANNDKLGSISFWGRGENAPTTAQKTAEILCVGDDTWAANDHPSRLVFYTTNDGEASQTESMRINQKGTLCIGRTDSQANDTNLSVQADNVHPVEVKRSGTSNQGMVGFYNDNGQVGSINTNGSATVYATSSDYRMKENVVALTGAATRLKSLKPYRFNFKTDATKTVDGFLAHEVETTVPEAISGEKDAVVTQSKIDLGIYKQEQLNDPVYQKIDHSKLVPLLVAALQEALTRIETLEAA